MRVVFIVGLIGIAFMGYCLGTGALQKLSIFHTRAGEPLAKHIHPELEVLVAEAKSFVVVLVTQQDADWCERSLRSIFEQEYENFRLILIDDGSTDGTFERASHFILSCGQEHRAILIQNETSCGFQACLQRAAIQCHDFEIMVPLSGSNWMASPMALSHLNQAFQNKDVWIVLSRSVGYPSYELLDPPQLDLKTIAKKGWGAMDLSTCKAHSLYSALLKEEGLDLLSLLEKSGGRVKSLFEPALFINETKRF